MSTTLASIALGAIQPLVDATIASAARVVGTKIKKLKTDGVLLGLTRHAAEIGQVKTLLCLDKPLHITDFYSPQYIEMPGGQRVDVGHGQLQANSRVIVTGVAGQGKSILFRYLALTELANKRLPIFIELRNYQHNPSLDRLLAEELETLGFSSDGDVHEHVLGETSPAVFLDAFDEVPSHHQMLARRQIETFLHRHPRATIWVSSRPSLEIEASNHFLVTKLSPLSGQESVKAMHRMSGPQDDAAAIEKELNKTANKNVVGLLSTPLMVLLILHYRMSSEFPSTIQSFYGDLFEVLFKRHDQTKGYKRVRKGNASENELRDLFGYLCFAMRRKDTIEDQRAEFLRESEQGVRFFGRAFDAAGALDDIIRGTNLILEDGFNCRFAHRSIQELNGARFLIAQAEQDVQKFLRGRVKAWNNWRQFLEFTELLNRHLFCKHFLAPHVGWAAFDDEAKRIDKEWVPTNAAIERLFGDDVASFREEGVEAYLPRHEAIFYPFQYLKKRPVWQFIDVLSKLETDWSKIPPDPSSPSLPLARTDQTNVPLYPFTIRHLLGQPQVADNLCSAFRSAIVETVPLILSAYAFLDHRAGQTDLFG